MFTPAALRACVFILKRFFCQIQCIDWAKCESTRTEDNFQLCKINFSGVVRVYKATWVNMGL